MAQRFDVAQLADFRDQVLALAGRALTPDAVNTVIEPTLDEVLSGGRFEVISIGFVIALWSGSRALNVVVDTITIMYGMGGQRGIVRTRALSFVMYLVFLLVGVVLLPLVLAGPTLVSRLLPSRVEFLANLYWPFVLLGTPSSPPPTTSPYRSGPAGGLICLARCSPSSSGSAAAPCSAGCSSPRPVRPRSTGRWPPLSPS